jgi:hypothetical protein
MGLLWFAILICLALAGWLAWTRGGWLDEYWTVWHTDPAVPFGEAYWTRWVRDTQHPPAFYALAWSFGHLTGSQLGLRRLAGDAIGLLLLVPPLLLSRRHRQVPASVMLLLLTVCSGPYAVTYFAEHRSYALGLLAATALLLMLREVHLRAIKGQAIGVARSSCLLGTGLIAGNLHYTLAMVQLILLGCFSLFHAWRRDWRIAGLLAAAGVVIAAPLALALWLALRQQAPVVAIHVGLWAGWRTIAVMLALGLGANLVLFGAALPAGALWWRDPVVRTEPRASLVAVLVVALVLAAVAFAGLEVLTHNMYPRLLLGLLPPAGLVVAEFAAWKGLSRRLALLAALNAVLVAGAAVIFQWRDPRIDRLGPVLAEAVRRCPTTRIVAVDPLALTAPDDLLRRMTGQDRAVAIGYRMTAARWHVSPRLWPEEGAGPAPDRRCPTLIWMEHGFMLPQGIDAPTLLARLHLTLPMGARVSEIRDKWHYLVRVAPAR